MILRYYHDLKVKDIATITGVGVSTVQSRIYQGLRKLEDVYKRQILQRGLPFEVKIPSDRPVDISTCLLYTSRCV